MTEGEGEALPIPHIKKNRKDYIRRSNNTKKKGIEDSLDKGKGGS